MVLYIEKEFKIQVSSSFPKQWAQQWEDKISTTTALLLESERANITVDQLKNWSKDLIEHLKKYDYRLIWNWDESSDAPKSISKKQVYVSKQDQKSLY